MLRCTIFVKKLGRLSLNDVSHWQAAAVAEFKDVAFPALCKHLVIELLEFAVIAWGSYGSYELFV